MVEHGATVPLRAYIRESSDVSLGFERISTVSDVEAALAIVRAWLQRALDADPVGDAVPASPL
jgi:hypothetical protein